MYGDTFIEQSVEACTITLSPGAKQRVAATQLLRCARHDSVFNGELFSLQGVFANAC